MARQKNGRGAAPVAEPILEEVEGSKGLGIDGGISIATFLLLCGAIAFVWVLMGERYPAA